MTNPLALPGSKYLQLSQPNPCITTCQVKPWMAETWSSQILLFYLQMGQIENTAKKLVRKKGFFKIYREIILVCCTTKQLLGVSCTNGLIKKFMTH